jgi:1,2-diacylglycerol 3-alpha-glucosyltransferase
VGELKQNGQNGFKFDENAASWSEATNKALNSTADVKAKARRTAEGYSIHSGAEKLLKIYEQSIASKKARLGA